MREMLSDLLPTFLRIALSAGAALLILAIGVLLMILVVRSLRVKADRDHRVSLINTGNCQSRFEVWVESGQPDLRFDVLLNNVPLAQVEETIEELIEIAPKEKPVKVDKKKRKRGNGKQANAIKTGQAVASKAGAAASLLGTVGSVIPGEAGAGLKAQAENVRGFQAQTAKTTQAPQAAQRKLDALQTSSGRLGVKTNIKVNQGSVSNNDDEVNTEIDEQEGFERRLKKVISKSENGAVKVQTPELNPGEQLTLTLRIGKRKRKYPVGSFAYDFWSQMIAVDERFGKGKISAKKGLVAFQPIAGLRYFLPGFCGTLVMLASIVAVIFVIPLIWGSFV